MQEGRKKTTKVNVSSSKLVDSHQYMVLKEINLIRFCQCRLLQTKGTKV